MRWVQLCGSLSILWYCLSLGLEWKLTFSSPKITSYQLLLLLLLSRFSHVQLCNPINGSPSGSEVPGILQARTLEWVAISFSNAWKWKVKGKSLSHVRLLATPWTAAYQALPSMGFSRQEYWSGVPLPSLYICTKHWKIMIGVSYLVLKKFKVKCVKAGL